MNLPDRLRGLRARIERHRVALSASIVLLMLGLVGWNQGRTSREIAELKRLVRQGSNRPTTAPDTERAIALGRDAVRKGQWDLGQIYLVNAITNAPGDLRCLRDCAAVVLEGGDPPLDAIDRLSSMLQLAAYQVEAAEVPQVVSLINRAEQARQRILGAKDRGVPRVAPKPGTALPPAPLPAGIGGGATPAIRLDDPGMMRLLIGPRRRPGTSQDGARGHRLADPHPALVDPLGRMRQAAVALGRQPIRLAADVGLLRIVAGPATEPSDRPGAGAVESLVAELVGRDAVQAGPTARGRIAAQTSCAGPRPSAAQTPIRPTRSSVLLAA